MKLNLWSSIKRNKNLHSPEEEKKIIKEKEQEIEYKLNDAYNYFVNRKD
ncbi:hypothetical protein [Oceanirhabdus sp. W0125-5]|nr:hypothetical protein [Oceanirhabdus sp. W0125-5]WBW97394.1 hypothetical protein OW730_00640 [Oceanirhabdus sp. W0125-5]